jgi:hypothetical protein
MDGMRPSSATYAKRRGWAPLSAWTDRTIADPKAQPVTFDAPAVDDQDDSDPDISFIDPMLKPRVMLVAQKVDEVRNMRNDDHRRAYLDPIGRVTRLEAHAVTAIAVAGGMSSAEIGQMLGYPSGSKAEILAGERQVSRLRANVRQAGEWLASPATGQTPEWLMLSRTTTGRDNINLILPALLAVQAAPYGPGWSIEELAERCAVDVPMMTEFLVWASREGDRMWDRQTPKKTSRRRTPTRHCATRGTARAA